MVTAGSVPATTPLLAPLLGLLPNATLAAVAIRASVGLIHSAQFFFAIRKVRTMEFHGAYHRCAGRAAVRHAQGHRRGHHHAADQPVQPRPSTNVCPPSAASAAPTRSPPAVVRAPGTTRSSRASSTAWGWRYELFFVNAQDVVPLIVALVVQIKRCVPAVDMSRVPDIEGTGLGTLIESDKRATERGAVERSAGVEISGAGGRGQAGWNSKRLGERGLAVRMLCRDFVRMNKGAAGGRGQKVRSAASRTGNHQCLAAVICRPRMTAGGLAWILARTFFSGFLLIGVCLWMPGSPG